MSELNESRRAVLQAVCNTVVPSIPHDPDPTGLWGRTATDMGADQGIEIVENASFWDVRAKDRLVIDFDQVSEELGFDVDPYAMQHEMSTHYGRLVVTDDALMLFSDPVEAMEYLSN